MKGNKEVILMLNNSLSGELFAINQYMLHHSILENIGRPKLGELIKKQAIDEMRHAEKLIGRILFLDGHPLMGSNEECKLEKEPQAILETQLKLEQSAVDMYRQAADVADKANDYVTRALFEEILAEEELHYDWLETQLGLIKRLGFAHYEASLSASL